MIVVLFVAIGSTLWILGVRSRSYVVQANYHRMQEDKIRWVVKEYEANRLGFSGWRSIEAIIDRERRLITYHETLKRKYQLASSRPWLPVEPDPPEP